MGLVRSFRVNNQTILVRPLDATSSLVFIDGYANGVFKGDNAWSTINPMTQSSQPGKVGPNDPTSFDDIDIEIPDITIQNVGPQDITASASLADVYNAGQSINGRWAVQSCKPAVNTDGRIILTMHIGANAPPEKSDKTIGRPVIPFRKVLDGIVYILRTGCQWKMLPKEYGSGSTCHRRFQEWTASKVFQKLWVRVLKVYDDLKGIRWTWQSLDSISVKAPLGGILQVQILQTEAN